MHEVMNKGTTRKAKVQINIADSIGLFMEEWDPELQLLISGLASLAEGLLSLCHLVTPAWSIINGLFSFANENSAGVSHFF